MTAIEQPPCVLGIDSALSRTGVAIIERTPEGCRARTDVVASPTRSQSILDRHHRIIDIVGGVRAKAGGRAELALIEAPALAADHGNAWDRAAVWWGILSVLLDRDVPVAMVAPTTLKKWATGRGGSAKNPVDKPDVVKAMHAMWPGVPATCSDLRHHECEALAMAHMCAQHLGWPVPVRRHHGEPLAVVKWPRLAPVGAAP
ncbi:MAG: hypothetical protein ACRDS1_00705 [Pseudonocardiaceae bacterium]